MNRNSFIIVITILVVIGISAFLLISNKSTFTSKPSSALPTLKKVGQVPLSGRTNRWDYQSINYENNRLYISHLGSDTVTVFGLKAQKIIKDVALTGSPYGILVVPNLHSVYVSVGGKNQVAVIDENSLEVTKYIQAGETPDGLAYDPSTNKIFVSNENGRTITVINASKNEKIEDIFLGGSVGNTHYDPITQHIFSVSGQENTLVEINPATDKIMKKYETTSCSHPHGFYIDEKTHYAFITCQGNNKMIVFDLDKKKIIFTDTVGDDPDVLAFDPGIHHLYVAAESGILAIFNIKKKQNLKS